MDILFIYPVFSLSERNFQWNDNDEFQDLTLGSTYASVVDHWIGRGVLERHGNRFIPKIVSKEQYEKMKKKLVKVRVEGVLPMKNYRSVEVFERD